MKHLLSTCGLLITQRLLKSISMPSNDQRLPTTSKDIQGNLEGIHNKTMVPINSYQPNAQSFLA
jgi:hypothetical protein